MASDSDQRHTIGVVTRETGLTAELVRIWEKRYAAVSPMRTSGGHRLYSEADISRLKLLRRATESGHRIGTVAQLSEDRLHDLIERMEMTADEPGGGDIARQPVATSSENLSERLAHCMEAVRCLDEAVLQRQLESSLVALGLLRFVDEIVEPLMTRVGNDWESGRIRPAQEHMASAVVRSILYSQHINKRRDAAIPAIVITTPPGQLHEIGALAAALSAEAVGWRVIYLGPDLPIEEIAMSARQTGARAVALSLTVASDRTLIAQDFQKLARLLDGTVTIITGGRSAQSFKDATTAAGGHTVESLPQLRELLSRTLSENPGQTTGTVSADGQ